MRRPFALMIAAAVTTGGLALTPAATSAPIEAGTLDSPGQASPAAEIKPAVFDDGPSKSRKHKKIRQTEVCFTVHNLGDPTPYQVSGTLFHTKAYTAESTALLLQHGPASERSTWDGLRPSVDGVPSMARQLAGAGYGVFAIDRLGYGRSPYPGSGWALTVDSYVEMTHEMVTQIRSGTYRVTTDTCSGGEPVGRPAAKVVLVGLSGGAAITELYATRYHDIDGIVPMAWSSQGAGRRFGEAYVTTVASQWLEGKDYVYLFPPEPDGYSQACEDWIFYTDGVSEDAVEQTCGPEYFGDVEARMSPSGEAASLIYATQEIKAGVGLVGPTPALLVFADRDAMYPTAEFGDGEDVVTPEMEMWSSRCNCDVSFLMQENSGHAGLWHNTAPEMTNDVITWLRSRGL
ncbi:MAG: alpha/beta hydrolase [Actinomycetota bacterium]